MNKLLQTAITAAIAGGKEIIEIYEKGFEVEYKEDDSPLTIADKNAHLKIKSFLDNTGIPILSEEGKHEDFAKRKDWNQLWIVDPLDGTKEFVKRNGEFTVNIALIENGTPIAGVIYVPVQEMLYFGEVGEGTYKVKVPLNTTEVDEKKLKKSGEKLPYSTSQKFTIVASRSHPSKETEAFIEELKGKHGEVELTSIGSSLKICLVAEGTANIYPRFAPTMEWDTAAGHAILKGAGKELIDYETKKPMVYNRKQLRNNWFIAK